MLLSYIKANDYVLASQNIVQIKTESGSKVKAAKTGIYKKWKERSHMKVSLHGMPPDGNADEGSNSAGNALRLEEKNKILILA